MKIRRIQLVAVAPLIVGSMMLPGTACDQADALGENPLGDLCCDDFTVGADMSAVDWGIEGDANVKFGAFMQATGDLSAAATAVLEDVSGACRAIAVDLDATPEEIDTADSATQPNLKVKAWCDLAVAKINTQITAKGSISIVAQPPSCSVSASAQAKCEGKCTANVQCEAELGNIEARCDPGKLSGKCEATCQGSCEGSANLAVSCEGTCQGTCDGTCEGTCEGKCDGVDGSAACSGRCEGTCSAKCTGKCSGSCAMEANATVTCEGDCTGGCSVDYKAPKCTAELTPPSAECQGDAECSGSCKASASAKAECRPGSITIQADASINAQHIASLQLNLPKILAVFQARGKLLVDNAQAVVQLGGSISGEAPNFSVKAAACVIPAVLMIGTAAANATASLEAAGSVAGSVNVGG